MCEGRPIFLPTYITFHFGGNWALGCFPSGLMCGREKSWPQSSPALIAVSLACKQAQHRPELRAGDGGGGR